MNADTFSDKQASANIHLFSIVMPAYNEEDVIEETLLELIEYLDHNTDFNYEVVVVNDGSSDQTESILHRLAEQYPPLRPVNNLGDHGYGYAIRKGLDEYHGDAVVIVTSDGADAPRDVAAYFAKINEGYHCAFGSRFAPGARVTNYPKFKLLINRFANRFLALLLRSPYNDFTNGFKCYRREVIDSIQPMVAGQFNITIELAVSAVLGKWSFAVVPNDWAQRVGGESSFHLGKLFKPYLLTLIYCMTRNYLRNSKR
jgi:dolichol-phosphate mannosyltransferase